jgi:hypothetical protein
VGEHSLDRHVDLPGWSDRDGGDAGTVRTLMRRASCLARSVRANAHRPRRGSFERRHRVPQNPGQTAGIGTDRGRQRIQRNRSAKANMDRNRTRHAPAPRQRFKCALDQHRHDGAMEIAENKPDPGQERLQPAIRRAPPFREPDQASTAGKRGARQSHASFGRSIVDREHARRAREQAPSRALKQPAHRRPT